MIYPGDIPAQCHQTHWLLLGMLPKPDYRTTFTVANAVIKRHRGDMVKALRFLGHARALQRTAMKTQLQPWTDYYCTIEPIYAEVKHRIELEKQNTK